MTPLVSLALLLAPLGETPALLPGRFDELHALIRPQAGEFAWYEDIPWLTSLQAALEKGAAEGKPVLVWTSADGQPCGAT
jgi:hypothetical protein